MRCVGIDNESTYILEDLKRRFHSKKIKQGCKIYNIILPTILDYNIKN